MKRIINICALCVAAASLSSCHFLEVEKIGKSDIESFFESEESIEAAVIGCMDLLNGLYDDYAILYPEICGDLVVMNASESGMWSYLYNFDLSEAYNTTPIGFVWNVILHPQIDRRVNWILKQIRTGKTANCFGNLVVPHKCQESIVEVGAYSINGCHSNK